MRVFVAGGRGQLGRDLLAAAPKGAVLEAPTRKELSITDRLRVAEWLKATRPDLVINSAAYTSVNDAESNRAEAFAVNAEGARALAEGAAAVEARMIHVSTDFVFSGKQGLPYLPRDTPDPLGVYGASKLAGERAVLDALPGSSLVVRTSWLYSSHGRNFVSTMIKLLAERPEVSVVADQIGSPTWTRSLAEAIWTWSTLPTASGLRHFSDVGVASWYDLAVAIRDEATLLGLLDSEGSPTTVRPIRTEDFSTPARRPPSSILDSLDSWAELRITPRHWRASLHQMFTEMKKSDSREFHIA